MLRENGELKGPAVESAENRKAIQLICTEFRKQLLLMRAESIKNQQPQLGARPFPDKFTPAVCANTRCGQINVCQITIYNSIICTRALARSLARPQSDSIFLRRKRPQTQSKESDARLLESTTINYPAADARCGCVLYGWI